MKLDSLKLASSIALAFALIHTSFDLLSLLAPELLKFTFNSWFHGFNTGLIILQSNHSYDFPKIIFGWLTSVATAWVIGYLIGFFYNLFSKGPANGQDL